MFRGGAFFRQGGSERVRVVYRLGTLKKTHSGLDVGFRLNGVRRSGYMSESRIWYSRCAGYRNGDYSKTLAMETIGFRLNGVVRGGYYGNPADRFRCGGYRNGTRALMYVHGGLGFRAEWCITGVGI